MKYEYMDGDPARRGADKTKKNKRKESIAMLRKKNKEPKSTNINDMTSRAIVWHLVYKHRVGILILALVLSWTAFIVTRAPVAMQAIQNAR